MKPQPKLGDCVLGTKFGDAHPQNHFAIGYYGGLSSYAHGDRHRVLDSCEKDFRLNGFRRVEKITSEAGNWLCKNASWLEKNYKHKSLFRLARRSRLRAQLDCIIS